MKHHAHRPITDVDQALKLWGGWGGGGNIWTQNTLNVFKTQRTNGPVNAHLISWPSKAQNIQNLESFNKKFGSDGQSSF